MILNLSLSAASREFSLGSVFVITRDSIKALIHDEQILSTVDNFLLTNMSDDDATAIRAQHRETLTARHIMQYLEDAYGILTLPT